MRTRAHVPLILALLLAVTAPPPGTTARLLAGSPDATKPAPQARGRSRAVVRIDADRAATCPRLAPGPRGDHRRPEARRAPIARPIAARRATSPAPAVVPHLRC